MIPEEFWTTINPIPRSITELATQRVQEDTLKRYANALKEYCKGKNDCSNCIFYVEGYYGLFAPCKLDEPPQDWDLEERE